MNLIQIIHNPTAGEGQHSREQLIEMVTASGHGYHYASTDDSGWKDFHLNKIDAYLVAGGDGTVRKLAMVLLANKLLQQKPIFLLPLGTANNIAETLSSEPYTKLDLSGRNKKYDCGRIDGLGSEEYFIESLGFGIFPELIAEMEKEKLKGASPEEEMDRTLEVLLEIAKNFKAKKAKIKVHGIKIKGSFLLVELLNIQHIGPNLMLAPDADPGDAYFELVLIPEDGREDLVNYIENIIQGKAGHVDPNRFISTLKVKKVKMKWKGSEIHVDDDIVKSYSGKSFTTEVIPGALEFFI